MWRTISVETYKLGLVNEPRARAVAMLGNHKPSPSQWGSVRDYKRSAHTRTHMSVHVRTEWDFERENAQLEIRNERLRREIQELTAVKEDIESRSQIARDRNSTARRRLSECERALVGGGSSSSLLSNVYHHAYEENVALRDEFNALTRERDGLTELIRNLNDEMDRADADKEHLEGRIARCDESARFKRARRVAEQNAASAVRRRVDDAPKTDYIRSYKPAGPR